MNRLNRMRIEKLEPRMMLAAQPIITEFMASNNNTLEDGDGSNPDWIEIYNNGDQSTDLAGYRLTDDSADLNKWVFPSITIAPGEYVVVFASGDNTPDSAGNLHTNFQLSSNGEYLALVSPGGSVLSEFGPGGTDYPAQEADVSYGLAYNSIDSNPVTPDSVSRYFIPNNNSVDNTWTSIGFDDSSWNVGTASIGYENTPADYVGLIQTTIPSGTTSAYVRIDFNVSDSDAVLDKLQMKYDDGFIAYINGTQVASANAPGVGAFNSTATEDHPDALAVNYVDFDLSAFPNLLNVGTNTLAIHMLNRNSGSSDMLSVPNLLLTAGGPIEPNVIGSLTDPTPGLPNTNLVASAVQFSQGGGIFVNSFQLTMTAGPGESIRYTTDGTNPDENSTLYAGPITVNSTTQFRARSFGPNGEVGRITTDTFVQSTQSVANFNSDLPVIVLENFGQGIPDRDFQDSTLTLYDIDPQTGRSSLSNPADFTSVIGQHRRGKSTFSQPKYNLRIELRDNFGEDQNESLLGMPSESDWILYAPFTIDRSLIRNVVAYDLGRQTGDWAPRTRLVEVYSNTGGGTLSDSDYFGVYVLMENIKRDNDRVDIAELTPSQNSEPEISGGYILQIDQVDEDDEPDSYWDATNPNSQGDIPTGVSVFKHVSPERDELTSDQTDYIRDYIQDAMNALYGNNSTDPLLGYEAYFDVDSAVKFHIFNVFYANPDAFRLSTYLTKDRDTKLVHGPLWDFDRGMGPDEDDRSEDPTEWMSDQKYFWVTQYWREFFDDPDFTQQWADEWQELRETVLSDANLAITVDTLANPAAEAEARNFARWTGTAPNGGQFADPGLTGWEAEVSHLKNWLITRANWIDDRTLSQPTFSVTPGNVPQNTQVTLSGPAGSQIYYTLDGSDPRGDGGAISGSAILYTGAITLSQSTQITARAFNSSRDISPVPTPAADQIGQWSGTKQGVFSVELPADASSLRITELHYHPANPTPGELALVPGAEDNDFEFIELKNISNNPISLNNVTFDTGITFDFTTSNVVALNPGEIVVVVEDIASFEARYGSSILVAGEWAGGLSNSGEQLVLRDSNNLVIHDFTYTDDPPWATEADGDGPSLIVIDTNGNYSDGTNWRISATPNGTPGIELLPGDYNRDRTVDQLDYDLFTSNFGNAVSPGHSADGNFDGVVNIADYTVWRDNLGLSAPATSTSESLATIQQANLAVASEEEAASAELVFYSPISIPQPIARQESVTPIVDDAFDTFEEQQLALLIQTDQNLIVSGGIDSEEEVLFVSEQEQEDDAALDLYLGTFGE